MVVAVAVAVGVAAFVVLAVMLVSLARQASRLAGAVSELQRVVRPALEEMRREAESARPTLERVRERREEIAASRRR